MHRSIVAVLLGTFTLRFSTGLTGGLLSYYLADLPRYGGPEVSGTAVGIMTATYFVAELVLSPAFGVLSDRLGAHRVMQWGPVFGAVAVIMTALTTNLFLLGVTRWLEGAAAGASIPSILGYIALATAHDEPLRGRVVARFEAATLAGIGGGIVAAGWLYDPQALGLGSGAFFVNAGIYVGSLLIYRYGVAALHPEPSSPEPARPEAARPDPAPPRQRFSLARYRELLRAPQVWLLAPTWIALNAVLGAWTTQSVFQLVREPSARFESQLLMGGFEPWQVSIGLAVAGVIFFAGLFYWGGRFGSLRRTSIIAIGLGGAVVMVLAAFVLNHSQGWAGVAQIGLTLVAAAGLFVMAGATPAALGLLADISESHPADRGAIMGLYSVFLGLGQIIGALASGSAADLAGIDGLLLASLVLLAIAVLPIHRLRESEHLVGTRVEVADIA
ncbi:MAG TPA: MFS transporter [candidate division Zixibacteria bacterium]|nr:MFS transporter [candidate division Zixibacteria bacterium]